MSYRPYSRSNSLSSARGVAMLEFSLFLPVILILLLFIVEVGSMFGTAQDLALVSRETANLVYRNCIQEAGVTPIDSCVRNTLGSASPDAVIHGLATRMREDFDSRNGAVLVTLYRWSAVNNQWQGTLIDTVWAHTDPGKTVPLTRLATTLTSNDFRPEKNLFVAVEVISGYEPIALGRGLNVVLPNEIYRQTAM